MDKAVTPPLRGYGNEEAYQFFHEGLCQLYSERSILGLVKSFCSRLCKSYQILQHVSLSVSMRGGCYLFSPVSTGLDYGGELGLFSHEFLAKAQQLLCISFEQGKLSDACMSMVCAGSTLEWICLGKPQHRAWLCLWPATKIHSRQQFDLYIQLLQREAAWYCKLDQTQALLYRDELTGLFNYRYLDIALENELRRANRYQHCFSLLFIDLDDFKQVNDRFGHLGGSSVLRQFGKVLSQELREVDTIVRYGGDEYVVMLLGSDTEAGFTVAASYHS